MTETRKWSIATAAVVVVVFLASWFLLIAPKRSEASALQVQTVAQQASNAQLVTQIQVLKQQAKSLPKQEAKLEQLNSRITPTSALPSLIVELTNVAQKSGVTLVSMNPATPVAVGTAAAPGTALTPDQLAAINVSVQVQGGFFEIQQFLNGLEKMNRAFLVAGLSVAESDSTTTDGTTGTTTGSSTGSLSATISGRVFMAPTANSLHEAAVVPDTTSTTTTTVPDATTATE